MVARRPAPRVTEPPAPPELHQGGPASSRTADRDLKLEVLRGAQKLYVVVPALQHREKSTLKRHSRRYKAADRMDSTAVRWFRAASLDFLAWEDPKGGGRCGIHVA